MLPAQLLTPETSDLSVQDCHLLSYVKSKVYETTTANIDDPQPRIRVCIRGILKEMLQWVRTSLLSQLQKCFDKTWWSRTKCHFQSVMININSHGHGTYCIIKKIILLKPSFQKPSGVLAHPVLNRTKTKWGYGLDSSGSEYGPAYGYCDLGPMNFLISSDCSIPK